ncbi:hypothetical protein [Pedobacter psychrodurus]|uniref:hypothetical protein n=1 Tax=Pedobacter psychrodurus TaxID=2530456 RepID=UPI0013F17DD1|nr:hypothetical protein [Pedobacter psychrodurus]
MDLGSILKEEQLFKSLTRISVAQPHLASRFFEIPKADLCFAQQVSTQQEEI